MAGTARWESTGSQMSDDHDVMKETFPYWQQTTLDHNGQDIHRVRCSTRPNRHNNEKQREFDTSTWIHMLMVERDRQWKWNSTALTVHQKGENLETTTTTTPTHDIRNESRFSSASAVCWFNESITVDPRWCSCWLLVKILSQHDSADFKRSDNMWFWWLISPLWYRSSVVEKSTVFLF